MPALPIQWRYSKRLAAAASIRIAAASSGTAAASAQPSHGASVHQYSRPSLSTIAISSIAGTSRPIVRKSRGSNALLLSLGGSGKHLHRREHRQRNRELDQMQVPPVMLGEHLDRKHARERRAKLGQPDTDDQRYRTQLWREHLKQIVDRHGDERSRCQPIRCTSDYRQRVRWEDELQQRGECVQTKDALRDCRDAPLDSRFHDRQIAARVDRDVDRRQQRHRRSVLAEGTRQARHVRADQGVAERRGDRSDKRDAHICATPPCRMRRRVWAAGQQRPLHRGELVFGLSHARMRTQLRSRSD